MGKYFSNKKLKANNALEVDLDVDKLKDLEIVKSSFLWGTNQAIFVPEKFTSLKPSWGGDMEWISSNNMNTYNSFLKAFESFGFDQILKDVIERENGLRLYAGFFLRRSSSKKSFHKDWTSKLKNNAFTLLTPLYQEEDALHLLYEDIDGNECKYKYKIGKGILFGSDFVHSTEPGQSNNCSILLCFQFGTDLSQYNQGIWEAMGTQTPFMILPDGRPIDRSKTKKHNEKVLEITTYTVPM